MLYWFASANRDETAFDDPFRVNLARTPNKHLAFGQGGPHLCLGMWLARLEVRVLFQELAKRIKSDRTCGRTEIPALELRGRAEMLARPRHPAMMTQR